MHRPIPTALYNFSRPTLHGASIAGVILAATFAFAVAGPAEAQTSGPTVAREDTMHTQVSEVLVRAPRVTLDEILDRVARGEARRESLIVDQQFIASFRLVRPAGSKGDTATILSERVMRVYKKKPNHVRTVMLREYERDRRKGNAEVNVDFRGGMDEEIVNFAFRPEARRDFRYRIVGRDFVGGHLIYRIEFSPKSPLDRTQPSGLVWVDTNEFVIVRQEVKFDRSPVPLFIKNVERMVIERKKYGEHWVMSRAMIRIASSIKLPKLGKGFDFSLRFDQYVMNAGIDDAIFREGTGR